MTFTSQGSPSIPDTTPSASSASPSSPSTTDSSRKRRWSVFGSSSRLRNRRLAFTVHFVTWLVLCTLIYALVLLLMEPATWWSLLTFPAIGLSLWLLIRIHVPP